VPPAAERVQSLFGKSQTFLLTLALNDQARGMFLGTQTPAVYIGNTRSKRISTERAVAKLRHFSNSNCGS
jgi:hypothetical protein